MTRPTSILTQFAHRTLGVTLAVGMAMAPLPVLASAPPAEGDAAGDAAEAAPATVGGNVAVLKFTGDGAVFEAWRDKVKTGLEAQGYVANKIKRSADEAAAKVKCKDISSDTCLDKIAAYLNKNSKTAYDFFVFANLPDQGTGSLVIWDIANKKKAVDMAFSVTADDYILPEVVSGAVARKLSYYQQPPTAATDEEKSILATLDEPEKTPEEIEAEKKRLADAEAAAVAGYNESLDAGPQKVDLVADFEEFCREGKREDKEIANPDGTTTKERDLRPKCSRGPVFGYWQPRAWVALTLTLGSAATMGAMYGLAAASRSQWNDANTALTDAGVSGVDPGAAGDCSSGECYADLAGAASEASSQVRSRAIVGDVFLGTTVLLAGVLAIIIYQDRNDAKNFIAREKELRAVSNLQVAPVFGTTNGAALQFDF